MSGLCACMGPPPGEQYCYCQRIQMGLPITYYEWTEDDKRRLDAALAPYFKKNAERIKP